MKSILKKIAIYSMLGVMQLGIGASVIEASPQDRDSIPMQQQYDRQEQKPNQPERGEKDRQERERAEKKRHEQEMKRRPHETENQWHERQNGEKERHEIEFRKIRENR
ncbi:MAG: hypothetical protein H6Q69_4053 [Firmicutes bacterium]|jgi:membrane protein involved in colicin uptake|nr:hypothetical protein [Bacillota bacterium]